MQNKLNEILELCIEKSKGGMFYAFYCDPSVPRIVIEHCYRSSKDSHDHVLHKHETMSVRDALEYMQNE